MIFFVFFFSMFFYPVQMSSSMSNQRCQETRTVLMASPAGVTRVMIVDYAILYFLTKRIELENRTARIATPGVAPKGDSGYPSR